jgi:HAD superfamily hydrolase (TIGR01549 family)
MDFTRSDQDGRPLTALGVQNCRAVLFDLDGTLYRQGPLRALMALELATLPLGGPAKAARRFQAIQAYRRAQEALRAEAAGQHSGPLGIRQLDAAAEASGLPIAEVEALVADWMIRRPLKYLQFCRASGIVGLLDLLERSQVKMGVLSDYPAEAKLRALGLHGRFSPVLSATDAEIDAFKPSPRGYLRACEIWGLPPSEVLFVGDRAEVDAAGARAAGMACVIIGRAATPAADGYVALPSFERLSRVFERR